ncbi:hypothetical protein AOQ84DRAFT_201350 [Glonium stellatum]|uniref:BHLH domain-containing protein n=1 Tax=Glonium stellatum TaxID=574774 RepID=A0A8E2JLU6_9PEZI|nr:hypothetical protein AOQ84DRAFT_201350 [Glonium stellatum]
MALDWAAFRPGDMLGGEQPSCASSDYSPATEPFSYPDAFSKANPTDSSVGQSDLVDDWMSPDLFDCPLSSVEAAGFPAKNPAVFNPNPSANLPNLDAWRRVNSAAFGTTLANLNENMFVTGLPFNTMKPESFDSSYVSPRDSSPTPSLCGDGSQLGLEVRPASPASSAASLKRDSPMEDVDREEEEQPAPKRVQRKRGRPRINRSENDPSSSYSAADSPTSRARASRRLPHNQVERKYREGLNSELERLRRAVPTLPQRDSSDLNGPPKPSKATVLASAIDYIKFIEAERERLTEENERLREIRPARSNNVAASHRSGTKLRNFGWSKNRSNSSGSLSMAG